MTTLKELEKQYKENKEIDKVFLLSINDILLELKLVEKDKDRKVPTPYVKAEIVIPHDIGKNIKEVLTSEWKLVLLGVKYKK